MMALGYYAGGCLNGANDNLIFTELFKRPDWIRAAPSAAEIDRRLALFERVMCHGVGLRALLRWPALRRFRQDQGRGLAGIDGAIGWMTKEPNCHLFIEPILARWPEAVFIYVTRHPLDMAFSDNKAQLGNWGWMFELDAAQYITAETAQLEYWIRTQRRLDTLVARYPGRLHPLNFDAFATAPEAELARIASTLGVAAAEDQLRRAVAGVIRPDSMGRWRERDLSVFDAGQLAFCRAAGWPVDFAD